MASNNIWAIIHAIQASGEITLRQVCQLLGCNMLTTSSITENSMMRSCRLK